MVYCTIFFTNKKAPKAFVVDPPGIEPGPHPCHGRVIPIYYGPINNFIIQIIYKKTIPEKTRRSYEQELLINNNVKNYWCN